MNYSIEQRALACCYALIVAAVATRVVNVWFDRRVRGAFGGAL